MYICSAKSNCDSDQYDSWLVCFPENFICFRSPYTFLHPAWPLYRFTLNHADTTGYRYNCFM